MLSPEGETRREFVGEMTLLAMILAVAGVGIWWSEQLNDDDQDFFRWLTSGEMSEWFQQQLEKLHPLFHLVLQQLDRPTFAAIRCAHGPEQWWALSDAVEQADLIELDLRLSQQGEIVLSHGNPAYYAISLEEALHFLTISNRPNLIKFDFKDPAVLSPDLAALLDYYQQVFSLPYIFNASQAVPQDQLIEFVRDFFPGHILSPSYKTLHRETGSVEGVLERLSTYSGPIMFPAEAKDVIKHLEILQPLLQERQAILHIWSNERLSPGRRRSLQQGLGLQAARCIWDVPSNRVV